VVEAPNGTHEGIAPNFAVILPKGDYLHKPVTRSVRWDAYVHGVLFATVQRIGWSVVRQLGARPAFQPTIPPGAQCELTVPILKIVVESKAICEVLARVLSENRVIEVDLKTG
jgi:hypothetical protein